MPDASLHLWTLSNGKEPNLGLSCTADGLFLGGTPLLECQASGFVPRTQSDLERLISRGFGMDAALTRVMPGLGVVASALNDNDLCRARIAAVQLCIPDLPNTFARLAMETEDLLIKVEARSNHDGGRDWNPTEHPRTGTTPNPGWFAPKDSGGASPEQAADDGEDKPLRLPPGERNDEIGDLLEWIANAKPEDAEAISGEISRLFYQYGDFADGAALHQALIEALANPDPANRQRILDQLEPISHHDPTAEGAVTAEIGIITGLRLPGRGAGFSAPAAEAAETLSDVWALGWARRGKEIHDSLGGNLPYWFKGIDDFDFAKGIATSFKSIDIRGVTYQDTQRLFGRITRDIDAVAKFDGGSYQDVVIPEGATTARTLKVVIPRVVNVTDAQQAAFDAATDYARSRGVTLVITPF